MKKKDDKPIFPATVVGGQPTVELPKDKPLTTLEVVLAFASGSATTRESFLSHPLDYARELGVTLSDTEQKMLDKTDRNILERMIETLEQSGSVTRRSLLSVGIVAATAFVGFVAGVPAVGTRGHGIRVSTVKVEIRTIIAATKTRWKEIGERLDEKATRIERLGDYLNRRFRPGKPFKLTIGFKHKDKAVAIYKISQDIKPNVTDEELRDIRRHVKHKCDGLFNGISFHEGERISVTIVFRPK